MVSKKLSSKNSNPFLWNIYPSWNPHMVAIPRVVLHFGWIISAPYTKVTIVEPWTKSKNKNRPTANNVILYCATIAVPIENTADANIPNTNVFLRPKRSEIWNDYNDWQKNWGWLFTWPKVIAPIKKPAKPNELILANSQKIPSQYSPSHMILYLVIKVSLCQSFSKV